MMKSDDNVLRKTLNIVQEKHAKSMKKEVEEEAEEESRFGRKKNVKIKQLAIKVYKTKREKRKGGKNDANDLERVTMN